MSMLQEENSKSMSWFTDVQVVRRGSTFVVARGKRYGRWWAQKALREDLRSDASAMELLRREFGILISLQHPGVATVAGMESVDGLGECIVMEWVEGQTLAEWLQDERRHSDRLHVIWQLLDAAEYACCHSGIALHSLHPSDVMVTHDGQNVKLISLGQSTKDAYGLLRIIGDMKLGWAYASVVSRCRSLGLADSAVVKACRSHFGRVSLLRRAALFLSLALLFVLPLGFAWHRLSATQRTIASLQTDLSSTEKQLHDVISHKQRLDAFVDGAKQHMRSRALYDLDTLNTYEACDAARMRLLHEMGTALDEYYTLHRPPVSYDYTYARFDLLDYRRDILQPLEEKRLRLLHEEGLDMVGR